MCAQFASVATPKRQRERMMCVIKPSFDAAVSTAIWPVPAIAGSETRFQRLMAPLEAIHKRDGFPDRDPAKGRLLACSKTCLF